MMCFWLIKLWKRYASECNGESVLLLNGYTSHKTAKLEDSLKNLML